MDGGGRPEETGRVETSTFLRPAARILSLSMMLASRRRGPSARAQLSPAGYGYSYSYRSIKSVQPAFSTAPEPRLHDVHVRDGSTFYSECPHTPLITLPVSRLLDCPSPVINVKRYFPRLRQPRVLTRCRTRRTPSSLRDEASACVHPASHTPNDSTTRTDERDPKPIKRSPPIISLSWVARCSFSLSSSQPSPRAPPSAPTPTTATSRCKAPSHPFPSLVYALLESDP